MRKETVTVSYECDECNLQFSTEDELDKHKKNHYMMVKGKRFMCYRHDLYQEQDAITIEVDHLNRKSLMEFRNGERLWLSWYGSIREEILIPY